MPPFQAAGVCPTCVAISPTFSLIESNSPERLFVIPEIRSSFSHSVIDSLIASMRSHSFPERAGRALHVDFHVNLPHSLLKSAEKPREKRNQGDTDESNPSSRDKLFNALRFGAGIVLPITFQQIDSAPDAERGSKRNDESLKSTDGRVEEFHIFTFFS